MPHNRNRAGRRGTDSRGANSNPHRQSTSASAVSRDGANATQNRRGGRGSSNLSKSTDNVQNGPTAPAASLPPPDDHVPMAGFNAGAVEALLKQGYEPKTSLYKPEAKSQTPSPSSPWGAKREYTGYPPAMMANAVVSWIHGKWEGLLA
ncbi:hypothetical protein A1O7_07122 [Cladophialophora yegresii CBS 114405]|uniref:Uncharacterized protein n=1 Tax=Cladophialophora yegresii CBS 114405 TaxID=1182544 RepID=W9VML7_9EURO|nr:uncharacterized protein A1O7_07122 [Cladophialophora yegresii CBS 114405]EXJ56778.1 hypothetical protein A1O7_07122 [Cladophialophora yegresii CBS 114405]